MDDYPELYTQVCESYRAIDDFRMKLLGLLPVATGAGVLVLLNSGKVNLGAKDQELERISMCWRGSPSSGWQSCSASSPMSCTGSRSAGG